MGKENRQPCCFDRNAEYDKSLAAPVAVED